MNLSSIVTVLNNSLCIILCLIFFDSDHLNILNQIARTQCLLNMEYLLNIFLSFRIITIELYITFELILILMMTLLNLPMNDRTMALCLCFCMLCSLTEESFCPIQLPILYLILCLWIGSMSKEESIRDIGRIFNKLLLPLILLFPLFLGKLWALLNSY